MDVASLILAGDQDTDAFSAAVDRVTPADISALLALIEHEDPNVRFAVAQTLPLVTQGDAPAPELVDGAITLSTDPDDDVRDWACFAFAEHWRELDTPAIREALAARLDDVDFDTRCEALVGLAYRRDPRALPRIRAALSRPDGTFWRMEIVAAGALGDPQLHDLVLDCQGCWDDPAVEQTVTIAAMLTDPAFLASEVVDGVAELYRRRAHGLPDGEALAAWQVMDEMLYIAPHRAAEFLDAVVRRLDGDPAAVWQVRHHSALGSLLGIETLPAPSDDV